MCGCLDCQNRETCPSAEIETLREALETIRDQCSCDTPEVCYDVAKKALSRQVPQAACCACHPETCSGIKTNCDYCAQCSSKRCTWCVKGIVNSIQGGTVPCPRCSSKSARPSSDETHLGACGCNNCYAKTFHNSKETKA